MIHEYNFLKKQKNKTKSMIQQEKNGQFWFQAVFEEMI